ncbi:Metallo-dependent phosphatase, partial [Fragilariopsis cylindrus CCMP1102]
TIGIIADIQYAPIPDGYNYTGTNARYYRHSLIATKNAFQTFTNYIPNDDTSTTRTRTRTGVDIVINLGDIVDGKCQDTNSAGMLSLKQVHHAMLSYTKTGRKILHTYGNHCLYNFNRTQLRQQLGIPFFIEEESESKSKSGHNKNNGFSIKFIILDGYDIALMKRSNTKSKKYKLAEDILKKENPINYKANNMNSPEGLEGIQKRFVGFNGAIGDQQLIWLSDELQQSRRNCSSRCNNQKVIVLCHQSIHPDSSNPVCVLWNYDKVLDILRSYSDIVIGAFSGHAHKGGYVRDPISGIHFRIIEAVLESKPTISTYGVLEIY